MESGVIGSKVIFFCPYEQEYTDCFYHGVHNFYQNAMVYQVQELLDKGYIRESLSPCVVVVILVPKRMVHRVCVLIVEALIILLFVIVILFLGLMICLMN